MNKRTTTPPLVRFWRKVLRTDSCWLWLAAKNAKGYGYFMHATADGRRAGLAHRFAYTALVGPIPDGMTLDHLCETKACVNPAHLVPATAVANAMRSGMNVGRVNMAKTHCPRGHEYTPENTKRIASRPNARYCRACHRADCASERTKALRRERWAIARMSR